MSEAVVVGSGPNGLAAAVVLARAGLSVELYEAKSSVGGGTRTEELIEPGVWHDICSAVHPMALASPFFEEFGLSERIDWFTPELSFAHPLDQGRAALAYRDLNRTADSLGEDGAAYRRLLAPLVKHSEAVMATALNPLLQQPTKILGPSVLGPALLKARGLWPGHGFRQELAPALLTGAAAHPIGPVTSFASTAAGLVLGHLAHTVGWPIPSGGSVSIANAMLTDFLAHGGKLCTDHRVEDLRAFSKARAVLLDLTPRSLLDLAEHRFPRRYVSALQRFRYNNAACKVDFILSAPVPWQHEAVAAAGTVHLGGNSVEIARSEMLVHHGRHPESPYVLVSQPSRFDSSRAPAGRQVLWTYCHVPRGSNLDMTERVIQQIERFAPGF